MIDLPSAKAGGILIQSRTEPLVLIPLSTGGKHGDGRMKYALIDAADYWLVMDRKWSAGWGRGARSYYAQSSGPRRGETHIMSRSILGLEHGDARQADHRNHVTLDNRRDNLRPATPAQNRQNARRRRDNTSGFKGVSLHHNRAKNWTRWRAMVGDRHLGYFATRQDAAMAYDTAARCRHGEFALPNGEGARSTG